MREKMIDYLLKVSQSVGLYLAICTNNFDKSAVLGSVFMKSV